MADIKLQIDEEIEDFDWSDLPLPEPYDRDEAIREGIAAREAGERFYTREEMMDMLDKILEKAECNEL